jgi:hypothetical protein
MKGGERDKYDMILFVLFPRTHPLSQNGRNTLVVIVLDIGYTQWRNEEIKVWLCDLRYEEMKSILSL